MTCLSQHFLKENAVIVVLVQDLPILEETSSPFLSFISFLISFTSIIIVVPLTLVPLTWTIW
jgi:hypothetical protein